MKYIVKIKDRELTFDYSEESGKITNQNNETLTYDFKELDNGRYSLIINGKSFVGHVSQEEDVYRVLMLGQQIEAKIDDEHSLLIKQLTRSKGNAPTEQVIKAPIPGLVTQVFVKEGDVLSKNLPLLTLEAMKMENVIKAPCACVVEKVLIKPGETVQQNQPLLELKEEG